jgi:hypothetical protein
MVAIGEFKTYEGNGEKTITIPNGEVHKIVLLAYSSNGASTDIKRGGRTWQLFEQKSNPVPKSNDGYVKLDGGTELVIDKYDYGRDWVLTTLRQE